MRGLLMRLRLLFFDGTCFLGFTFFLVGVWAFGGLEYWDGRFINFLLWDIWEGSVVMISFGLVVYIVVK